MSNFISNQLNLNPFYVNQENNTENLSSSSSENPIQSSSSSYEAESSNDSDRYPESPLNYITHVLMNETDKPQNHPEHTLLEATEKTFYDALGISYPPSQTNTSNWYDYSEYQVPFEFTGNSVFGITNKFGIDPAWQFNKGVEEGLKFLPNTNLDPYGFSMTELMAINSEKQERVRKNPHHNDERIVKQSVTSTEPVDSKLFDEVLLCEDDEFPKSVDDIRKTLQNVTIQSRKGRRRKNSEKEKEANIDLNTLLTQCAQVVALNDHEQTVDLLKQVRRHSSATGDGAQRTAHYFADALEARMAGAGVEVYRDMARIRETASEFMKAYQLYVAACPFKKVSYYYSNQTILNVVGDARSVHVVDLGINYGFQWPSLIKRLSARPGGAPRLRITGIDFPETGFRPGERIEETGRRLREYARSFNVPFEYNCIASKWEYVRVEELGISGSDDRGGEILVVNCLYQMRYLMDETVEMDSPRDRVLKTIRGLKPEVFVLGIVNGAYNAPFFLTRFREAMFYFSALYDMKDTIVPRGHEVRYSVEREILGREVMNVVACEGAERVERPENYKQWQARNVRAGFVQHDVNEEIMKKAKEKVRMFYHKEFDVEERSRWLLQGWKGRTIYALSSWKPK